MQHNNVKLKEKYSDYRIKMKSAKTTAEKRSIKQELSEFMRLVSDTFGQDVAQELARKKRG